MEPWKDTQENAHSLTMVLDHFQRNPQDAARKSKDFLDKLIWSSFLSCFLSVSDFS